jgi:hypothetical protein
MLEKIILTLSLRNSSQLKNQQTETAHRDEIEENELQHILQFFFKKNK